MRGEAAAAWAIIGLVIGDWRFSLYALLGSGLAGA